MENNSVCVNLEANCTVGSAPIQACVGSRPCKYNAAVCFVWQNRAQCTTELLQELNNEVSGNFVEEVCIKHFCIFWCISKFVKSRNSFQFLK